MNTMTSSIYRRFLNDIDGVIHSAESGRLIPTYNLLAFFCHVIVGGGIPDARLSKFVAQILTKSYSEKKRLNTYRKKNIYAEFTKAITLYPHRTKFEVAFEISSKNHSSISKISAIFKYPPETEIIDFCEAVKESNELSNELLKKILPIVHKIIQKIMNSESIGKAARTNLKLTGFGEWNSSEELHKEVIDEAGIYGVKHTAQNLGMKYEAVKKIRQRKK